MGAHNDIIADFATSLRRRLAPFRRAQFRTEGRLPRSHAEHKQVVDAIVEGDAAAAHTAMFNHMSLVEESFERLAETI
jgi:DNA-binding GntR family transcriptional regulator